MLALSTLLDHNLTMPELTARQHEILDAYQNLKTVSATARHLGISRAGVRRSLDAIRKKGLALQNWSAPVPIPDHLEQTKTTVQYNAKGEVIQEWRRLSPLQQLASEVVEGLCEQVKGKGRTTTRIAKKTDSQDICYELCLYDLHFGMYACAEETNDSDYDTGVASKRLYDASSDLLERTKRPKVVRIILGGDQLHADSRKNQTPNSGHVLDVDTRVSIVARKIIVACREVVRLACEVAEKVEIYVIRGNHDPESSIWLAEVLRAYYAFCDNVTICDQHTPRKVAVWGDCLSVYAHGDMIPPAKWSQIIASEFYRQWGKTRFRYARLGHFHHRKTIAPVAVDEVSGLEVTFLSSLASADAWHSDGGFVGTNRGMQGFELHRKCGQVSQFIYNVK